ncbi:MAG: dTDP-4-dehydrorhamnose 3,5-epimerase family protein [Pseudomonadota bacterium]
MRFEPTPIDGVVIVRWDIKLDDRGGFARIFDPDAFAAAGIALTVAAANLSRNPTRHTLRGLHYQAAPHGEPKLISCPRGRIWDVAVDLRANSPTYRRWTSLELSPDSDCAWFLPAGIAHGLLTLEDDSEVSYLMGAPFVPDAARGARWDDPAIGIAWPAAPALISERDATYPDLAAAS